MPWDGNPDYWENGRGEEEYEFAVFYLGGGWCELHKHYETRCAKVLCFYVGVHILIDPDKVDYRAKVLIHDNNHFPEA